MSDNLAPTAAPPIAYSAAGAAAAVGLGLTSIRAALRDGSLVCHYLHSKPIILASDLADWVRALPTVRPKPADETPG